MEKGEMGVGQNETRGPQVLVHVFIYQGSPFWVPFFDPRPDIAWPCHRSTTRISGARPVAFSEPLGERFLDESTKAFYGRAPDGPVVGKGR